MSIESHRGDRCIHPNRMEPSAPFIYNVNPNQSIIVTRAPFVQFPTTHNLPQSSMCLPRWVEDAPGAHPWRRKVSLFLSR